MLLNLQAEQPSPAKISPPVSELARARDFGRAFSPQEFELQVRYLRDSGCTQRLRWLREFLPSGVNSLEVSPDCEPLMTPLLDDSSVVIMHGAASARLVKAMEQMNPAFYDKVKIALLNEATPARRAFLLRSGFDDVLDLQSGYAEGRARIRAHYRRYSMSRSVLYRQNLGLYSWPSSLPRHYASAIMRTMRDMTIREKAMFSLLMDNFDEVVPYRKFDEELFSAELKDNLRSLRVAMCSVRSKVAHIFAIRSETRVGYRLTLSEEAKQAGSLVD
jgi:hypothetical protein